MGGVRFLEAKITSHPVWLIVLLGLSLNLSGTWLLPLIDRDEPRFAEASREMLARPDWVVPWFNGAPRYDKPPLIYWAQMACYRCLGETPLAARLPSALFATGTSLLLFFWARRLTKPRPALVAAVMFTTCLQLAVHARLAVADMPMIFFVCAAQWSGWEASRPDAARPGRWWVVFYVSLALGFLAKGPVAWLPVAGLALGRWLYPQQFKFSLGGFVLGMLLTLGLVALWGIPALLRTHGDFLSVGLGYHVFGRSVGIVDGHGAKTLRGWIGWLPFYLVTFFFSFFPWAFRFPQALRDWWPTRQEDVPGSYLLIQAGLVFLVFTLVRTKLPHYTLPAFPGLALWLARVEAAGGLKGWRVGKPVILAVVFTMLTLSVVLAVFLPVWWGLRLTIILPVLMATAVFAGVLKGWRGETLAAAMSVMILSITLAIGLGLRPYFLAHNLFEKARPQLQPAMEFAAVRYEEPSLVWEFGRVLTNHMQYLSVTEAVDFLHRSQPSVLIVPTSLYETNLIRPPGPVTVIQVQGVNWVTGSPAGLTALIHP